MNVMDMHPRQRAGLPCHRCQNCKRPMPNAVAFKGSVSEQSMATHGYRQLHRHVDRECDGKPPRAYMISIYKPRAKNEGRLRYTCSYRLIARSYLQQMSHTKISPSESSTAVHNFSPLEKLICRVPLMRRPPTSIAPDARKSFAPDGITTLSPALIAKC